MRAPTFQLMPKMRFIPAPLPEILPKVKKTGKEKADPDKSSGTFSIIMTNCMYDGHACQHADTVAGKHKGNAHDENGDEEPKHLVAIVGT